VGARSRRRLAILVLVMALVVSFSGGIAIYLLYDAAVDGQRARLHEAALHQARMIEAVARHDERDPRAIDGAPSHTLRQVFDAHQESAGFGRTGELVLARQVGDEIVFVLSQRHGNSTAGVPPPLPVNGDLATPMRRALNGESGSFIGVDYRGERVLAAYEPLEILDMGLVAKIDMAEIRQPFIDAALLAGGAAFLAIMISAFLFVRATRPLVRRVEETEAYSRSIVASAPDGILTAEDGRIISFNPACEQIFGYRADDALGRPLSQLLPGTEAAVRDGGPSQLLAVHATGADVPVEVTVSSLTGRKAGQLSLFIRDVSERRRLEAELRHAHKMEAIGTLASGVAHDFNNLLMGVTSSAEVALQRCAGDGPVHRHLEEIKSAALSGASITRQLLTFGRRNEAEPEVIDLNVVIADAEAMLRRMLGKDVELRVELADAPTTMIGDRGELEQILLNLAGNARHAMKSGGTLTVETAHDPDDDGVVLTFTDTGSGMSRETVARIFEPFFTTKSAGTGTGLGLASVYGIVQRGGGQIEVDSELGRGTTFRIWWPRASAQDLARSAPAPLERLRGDETILLVEDEALIRQSIEHHLERAGYRVLSADSAGQAMKLAEEHRSSISLLLTDIVLPDRTGSELAADLAADAAIPAVFMSAYSSDKLVRDGHLSPDTPALQKPFGERTLLTHLRDLLDRQRLPTRPTEPAGNRTILLVEDEAVSREAFRELLEDLGYDVLPAATGGEALAIGRANADAIDVVLTDLGLPDMSGGELVAALDALTPDRAVLFMTGRSASDPDLRDLLRRPRSGFVQKPVDFDVVAETIESLLADRSSAWVTRLSGPLP
jgi:PAS domain S-box-containing protein